MTCSDEQKVTTMMMKVDLDCYECYKKVKKLLCQFPQIRNQVFDEKNNVVIITVVCCSPERIRDKLCRKGGKSIKGIEIRQPPGKPSAPAPAQPEKPKPAPAPAQPDKPKPAVEAEKPKQPDPAQPKPDKPKPAADEKPKQAAPDQKPPEKQAANPAPPMKHQVQEPVAQWVPGYPPGPPPQMLPVAVCCTPCYEGRPCYGSGPGPGFGYGYGYGQGHAYQYGHPSQPAYYANSRCDYYLSEENPSACSIM